MRVRCGIVTAVLALAACGSSAGSSSQADGSQAGGSRAGAPAHCGPASGRTLAADSQARVYSTGGQVFGCVAGGARSFRLGAASRSIRQGRVGPIALAGKNVAYGYTTYGVDTVSAQVIVRRLSDGRQLRSAPATHGGLAPESLQSVDAIVVKPDGSVAWITGATSLIAHGANATEVARDDARGSSVLDSGSGIDVRSLRLHRSSLSWRDGSRMRFATLR